jgi:hypothetical protein
VSPLHPTPKAAQKPSTLKPPFREGKNVTPHRAGIATLTGRESALESGLESTANRTSITARIGRPAHPESGTGSASRDGKAAPHPGAARPKPTAKRKTLRTLRQPERLPLTLTRSRFARPGRLRTPTVGTLLGGRDHSPTVIVTRFEGTAPFSRLQIGKPKFMLDGIGL